MIAASVLFLAYVFLGPGDSPKGSSTSGSTDSGTTEDEPVSDDSSSSPDESEPPPDMPTHRPVPKGLTDGVRKQILASPVLAPAGGDFRATGQMDLVEQTVRSDGTSVLVVKAGAETRSAPGAPALAESVLVQVWVDPQGRVTETRTLGVKDADTAELEDLLDRR